MCRLKILHNLQTLTPGPCTPSPKLSIITMSDLRRPVSDLGAEMYSLMIDAYVKDSDEKDRLFRAVETVPSVGKKAEWALKWISA